MQVLRDLAYKVHMRSILCVTLALCAVGLSLGCGDDSSDPAQTPAAGKKYDPCVLLTQQDAETALSQTLKNTKHNTEAINATGQKICYYEETSGTTMVFAQLSLNEQASMTNGMSAEQLYETMKAAVTAPTTVAGVGDEAYYGGSGLKLGAGLTTLVKSKGVVINVMVGLGTGNTDEAAHLAMEKELTLDAISRL